MSALTFNLVRLSYLILLWLFVLAAIGVLRRDLYTHGRATKAAKGLKGKKAGEGFPVVSTGARLGPSEPTTDGYLVSTGGGGAYAPTTDGIPVGGSYAPADGFAMPVVSTGGGATYAPTADGGGYAAPPIVVGPGNNYAAPVTAAYPSALMVTGGALTGTWLPLGSTPITIGRAPGNMLVLDDGFASSYHARVFEQNGQWFLEDLNSTNGTFLGGQQVRGVIPLGLNEKVRIGESEIELVS